MNKLLLSITFLFMTFNVQAEEYFRSIDANGKVQYGDTPARDAADIEKLNARAVPSSDDSLPFEIRKANSKFPVTLYVGGGCGNGCSMAREFLLKRGIPFTEKNVVTPEDIAAFKKSTGGYQIPVMHIGKEWLVTFLESRWNQALDEAGYPKNIPYGFHPQVKYAAPAEKPKSE